MSLVRKYAKKIAIWFTVGVGLAFLTFSVAILPGVNIPGIPVVIVFTMLVHLCMYFWISWSYIEEPSHTADPPRVEDDFEIDDPWN